jgi:hypothetical protein
MTDTIMPLCLWIQITFLDKYRKMSDRDIATDVKCEVELRLLSHYLYNYLRSEVKCDSHDCLALIIQAYPLKVWQMV